MKLVSLLAVGMMASLSGAALAEPLSLTGADMDQVTAGVGGPFDQKIDLYIVPDEQDLMEMDLTYMSAVELTVPIALNDESSPPTSVPPTPAPQL